MNKHDIENLKRKIKTWYYWAKFNDIFEFSTIILSVVLSVFLIQIFHN